MTSRKLDVADTRSRLDWSQSDLAKALRVAPLTVQRWEKAEKLRHDDSTKAKTQKRKRLPGRPAQIPPFLKYALDYLLLREGKKRVPAEITIALPDTIGAALPTLASDYGFFAQQDLVVTVSQCETGTEALEKVYRGHAQVAGAASGLLPRFEEKIIDIGVVMRSPRAFNIVAAADSNQRLEDFQNSTILHPKGSDLENLLVALRDNYYEDGQEPHLHAVERRDAVEELKQAKKDSTRANTLYYIAWEPLASRVMMDLETAQTRNKQFRNSPLAIKALEKDLSYEFHLACSRQWYESSPAAAFDFMCALAHADLEFKKQAVTHMNELWQRYDLTKRSEEDWIKDLFGKSQRYTIAFGPSTQLFRLLGREKIVVVDRTQLEEVSSDLG
ncbi:MAG: hypothetical protein ACREBG_17745 [Pyrinomonadaceae bacterium]